MSATRRQQTSQSPVSHGAPPTAKYTNKDGSKFITVPKSTSSTPSPELSPAMAQMSRKQLQPPADPDAAPITVNRKKQKRRQKAAEAARLAAERAGSHPESNGEMFTERENLIRAALQSIEDQVQADTGEVFYSDEDGEVYSVPYEHGASPVNGYAQPTTSSKSSKKKKNKANPVNVQHPPASNAQSGPAQSQPFKTAMSKDRIWNTSSQEERERIKLFWLSLSEEERRSLVKVEKDAVLKKMKEQQKHSCSCTVCGRKRVAIEEELEVLYDAYYEELEQYANSQQGDGPPMMLTSRRFGPMSGLQPPHRLPPAFGSRQPSRGKIVEHFNDDDEEIEDEGDEEYSEDDYISDGEPIEEIPRSHATDFFNFGQSLTVQGGILTVADDLLKNDGKKFIEMMEQLAERRMAREEDAKEQMYANANGYGHPANGMHAHGHHAHNHPPPVDDDEYDDEEEDDEEYDSQDEDYDEEEMDTMTEEQRMEEGRRMFQIFAARMFEQRVLTAYKEKVAAERQEKLIQELEDEGKLAEQKKAKKAKDAQKKKEKALQKKLALAEEKAKREAEKAAEEQALREAEAKKVEEARLKAEEKRKKREAQKKAEEEERLKKEAEKLRRLQEQRERQAEQERKAREAKERERQQKEQQRQKEKEAKEAKEREAKEKREKQEREKKEQDAKAKAAEEARRAEQLAQQASTQQRKPSHPVPIPIPSSLHSAQSHASPHVAVATPVLPKAPTPSRPTQILQRDHSTVPQTPKLGKSSDSSPNPSTPLQTSPGPPGTQGRSQPQPILHHPQATSPMHAALKSPPNAFPSPFLGMQPGGINGFPGMPIAPSFGSRVAHDQMFSHPPPIGGQYRPPMGPSGMNMYPGMGIPPPQGRGFPVPHPPPGFGQPIPNGAMAGFPISKENNAPQTHSRQQSGSFDKPSLDSPATQPIGAARPAPIGRLSSVVHGQRSNDVDELTNQLGSSALLDDNDEPIVPPTNNRRASGAPIGPTNRQSFSPMSNAPFPMDAPGGGGFPTPLGYNVNTWGAAPMTNPFGPPSLPGSYGHTHGLGGWGGAPASLGYGSGMGGPGIPHRGSAPRSIAQRLMICRACRNLEASTGGEKYHSIDALRAEIERMTTLSTTPITPSGGGTSEQISNMQILDLCDTEGNPNNGGGFFDIKEDGQGRPMIRFEADLPSPPLKRGGGNGAGFGDIGSPVQGVGSVVGGRWGSVGAGGGGGAGVGSF